MKRDEAQIQSPCTADWDAMTGDDTRRHCGSCNKDVHNLSAMTEDAARVVVAQKDVCVRYAFNPRTRTIRHRAARTFMVRAAAAATLSAGLALPAIATISTDPGEVRLLQAIEDSGRAVWMAQERIQGTVAILVPEIAPVETEIAVPVMGEVEMATVEADPPAPAVDTPAPAVEVAPTPRSSVRMGRVAAPRVED
jgi:hypothetical protein